MNFGTRLRSLREERNLSQEKFGKVFSMKKSRISQYELGKRQPDHQALVQFAEFFGVSVDYLLGRTDSPFRYAIHTDGKASSRVTEKSSSDYLDLYSHIPVEIKKWLLDSNNLRYVNIAVKAQQSGIDPTALDKFVETLRDIKR